MATKPEPQHQCHWRDADYEQCERMDTTVYKPRNLDLCPTHLAIQQRADAETHVGKQA